MLPALWRRTDVKHTSESLADAIFRTLEAELVYVHVPDSDGAHASVRVAGDRRHDADAIRELVAPVIRQGPPASRLDVFGTEMNVLLQPIDFSEGDPGAVIVAATRSSFPSELDCALLRVATNQASVALQNARYVAELDRAALAREELVAELAAASRRKDQFLAVLGHELRNPLAAIHAAHSHTLANPNHARSQEIITHQLTTLTRLVDDLLDVSRVSTGKLTLQKQRLELRDVIDRARAASEHAAAQKGHRLSTNISAVPLSLDGDPVRLEQVLVNLLGNAIRYTPAGGHVSITASRTSDAHALIRVEDDGCGIPPELLPRIFEPFVQAEMSLHRTDGGLGLGLALVKGVVELHGGSVSIMGGESATGCAVLVRLPLVDPVEEGKPSAPAAVAARPSAMLRVLLVDDNTDMTEMLAAWLAACGHQTAFANDGLEALDVARRFSPDVAFVDIGLPGIDGYEVARRLRTQLQRRVVLIAMSGYGQDEDRARSHEAGFDDHLVKPVRTELILRILTQVGGG
ncbi:MAG TPA: ATP-binding protein [Polyangiaceae bacterium]|nr:ATP-binding protein [Polyangiaceae bacterium]